MSASRSRSIPGASLFKPNDQWDALVNGQLDIALFPLDYASGKVAAFSATLMPGLIRSPRARPPDRSIAVHDGHAQDHRRSRRDGAVRRLVRRRHGVEGRLHPQAGRSEGRQIPRRGPDFRGDVAGGRRQHRHAALERDLQRVPDRRRPGDRHQPRHLPLDAPLRTGQVPHRAGRQRALDDVRAGADVEEELRGARQGTAGGGDQGRQGRPGLLRFESAGVDDEAIKAFKDHKVEVATLNDAQFDAWLELAKKTSYADYAKDVPNGQKLLDEALR